MYFRYVLGTELFLCGDHIYTHYRDCKELGSYICGDKIVDVLAFYSVNVSIVIDLNFRKYIYQFEIIFYLFPFYPLEKKIIIIDSLRRKDDKNLGTRQSDMQYRN